MKYLFNQYIYAKQNVNIIFLYYLKNKGSIFYDFNQIWKIYQNIKNKNVFTRIEEK